MSPAIIGSQFSDMNIRRMLAEAQVRWLKPPEVCDLIENYQKYNFSLSTSPPNQPPSGSLFLFDRKVQRYFRKDGHNWRKKRDNRTVREAHERLKSGSVDVLHCYYAHGEEDYKFQRRCYWMLDPALEHIVLVHYRQVTEGGKFSTRPVDPPACKAGSVVGQLLSPSFSGGSADKELDDTDLDESVDTESDVSALDVEPIDQPSLHQQLDSRGREVYPPGPASGRSTAWPAGPPASRLERNFGQVQVAGRSNSGYPLSDVEQFMLNEDSEFAQVPDMSSWERMIPTSISRYNNAVVVKKEVDSEFLLDTQQIRQNALLNEAKLRSDSASTSSVNSLLVAPFEAEPKTELEASLLKAYSGSGSRDSELVNSVWGSWPTDNGKAQYNNFAESYSSLVPQGTSPLFSNTNASTRAAPLPSEATFAGRNTGSSMGYSQFGDFGSGTVSKDQLQKKTDRADSFNRWIERALCVDDDASLLSNTVQHSGTEWPASFADDTVAQLSNDMMVDVGAVSPSLSQHKFDLLEFSPEWTLSSVETKVLVTGVFLDTSEDPSECKWGVMFGEVEVHANYVHTGVLSCVTPVIEAGRVPFYVTRRDRQACSQVREFEFRDNLVPTARNVKIVVEELLWQTRLARMLLGKQKRVAGSHHSGIAPVGKMSSLDILDDEWADIQSRMLLGKQKRVAGSHHSGIAPVGKMSSLDILDDEWADIQSALEGPTPSPERVKDLLCELYLKQLLKDWLFSQVSEQENGLRILDKNGQGVLHLIAALGYSWGISPVLAAGYGINFRDVRGWTALHWAAAKGREECVAKLLVSGAAPALKTDPTPKDPAGRTAADLALENEFAGIAACLAEAALASRLSAMTIGEDVARMSNPTRVETFNLEQAQRRSEDMHLHESSVIAVKKATEAASAIQALNRQHSICRLLHLAESQVVESRVDLQSLNEEIRAWKAASVIQTAFRGHHRKRTQKQQSAALLIQRRYRGYKGRKAYLNIRRKVVRIQANVRGHLVRKQYRKILWSVGILEKAVLRWSRKRNGFRNFSAKSIDTSELEDFRKPLKDEFQKEIWRDVDTVRGIVDNAQALEDYNRMKIRLEQNEVEQLLSPQNTEGPDSSMFGE